MRRILYVLLLMFPFVLSAQGDASAFLEKAVAKLKADAAVHMDYGYAVYDEDGKLLQEDTGVIRIDGDCYSLLMDNMKVWCDGITQWSYMKDIDEVYITDAGSEEAQNLSPLYIMERFRKVSSRAMKSENGKVIVTLSNGSGETEKKE